MSNIISLKDIAKIDDKLAMTVKRKIFNEMKSGVKGTRIRMKNLATGEITELHNKVVISGSIATASNLFTIDPPVVVPSYNTALQLENSVTGQTPLNKPLICLFGVADEGCGTLDSDVYEPSYVDRISPAKLLPFRYITDGEADLSESERGMYFGRKVDSSNNIYYYFKAFDSTPQLYLRYTDGTEISTSTMYNVITSQEAECYVQIDLTINRNDFRNYFDKVLGWDKARISTLSLMYAWYTEESGYKWYQDIIPFTKLNFSYEKLVDSTKALSFEYSLFF